MPPTFLISSDRPADLPDRSDIPVRVVSSISRAIQGLLIARIVLFFFAAPAANPFVRGVMLLTDALVGPIRALVTGPIAIPYSPSILDTDAILALIVYTAVEAAVLLGRHLAAPAPGPLPPSPIVHRSAPRLPAPRADAFTPVTVSRVVGGVRRARDD